MSEAAVGILWHDSSGDRKYIGNLYTRFRLALVLFFLLQVHILLYFLVALL